MSSNQLFFSIQASNHRMDEWERGPDTFDSYRVYLRLLYANVLLVLCIEFLLVLLLLCKEGKRRML